jgi:uncharacterized membrane protein YheB (UPF0754 family)
MTIAPEPILKILDYDAIFQRLVQAVLSSPFGGMLAMFGGAKALEPLRGPLEENVRDSVRALMESPKLMDALREGMHRGGHGQELLHQVETIVQQRLNQLTPQHVKRIVQEMIRQHLGWLVVWGGVVGALIGLVASFL